MEMENKPLKFINTGLIVFLIIAINLAFFLVYYFANPELSVWVKLWNYLSSAIFTLVTGSLIIPLLFSILEKRYKFMENIQQQREEKKKQAEDQRRASRIETIDDTIKMWQDLYNLTTEVVFFDPDNTDTKEINRMMTDMIKFPSSAEVTVNRWGHQFPNLKFEDYDTFLHFVNVVYQSALSIILYIKRGIDQKQRLELQNMLYLILDQVKSIVHHRMIDIFKYSARLLELEESGAKESEMGMIRLDISVNIDSLNDWAKGITDHDEKYDNFLAPTENAQIDDIRKTAREIEKWLKEDKNRQVFKSDQFDELRQQFYNISLEDRVSSAAIPYTIEYIRAVADWLSFESACMYIYNRTHKIW
jgi:hypothetical protein